jgi:hypothetical protein
MVGVAFEPCSQHPHARVVYRLQEPRDGYPAGWRLCSVAGCGAPVLDGKETCGKIHRAPTPGYDLAEHPSVSAYTTPQLIGAARSLALSVQDEVAAGANVNPLQHGARLATALLALCDVIERIDRLATPAPAVRACNACTRLLPDGYTACPYCGRVYP